MKLKKLKTIGGDVCEIDEESFGPPLDVDECEQRQLKETQLIYEERRELIRQHFVKTESRLDSAKGDTYHEFAGGGYCILRPTDDGPRIVISRVMPPQCFNRISTRFSETRVISLPDKVVFDAERPSVVRTGTRRMKMVDGHNDGVYVEWIGLPLQISACIKRRFDILKQNYDEEQKAITSYYYKMRAILKPGDTYRAFTQSIPTPDKRYLLDKGGEGILRPSETDGLILVYFNITTINKGSLRINPDAP